MIKQNSLVQLTQSYCDWAERTPDFPKTVKEYIIERRFFYLGDVPTNYPHNAQVPTTKLKTEITSEP
jgi:hypothetical protein